MYLRFYVHGGGGRTRIGTIKGWSGVDRSKVGIIFAHMSARHGIGIADIGECHMKSAHVLEDGRAVFETIRVG